MGFNSNNSNDAVVSDNKLYTGIQKFKILAICPDMDTLHKLGFTHITSEPIYKQEPDDKGYERVYIDFYVKFNLVDRIQKIRFFLTKTHRVSNDGNKQQFIDKTGKVAWDNVGGNCGHLNWIDSESIRPCYVGEDQLHDLLINWLNVKPGDLGRLESPEKLFDLDLTELRVLHDEFKTNETRGLLVVNHSDDGKKYQNVYTGYFDRASNTSFTYWEVHISKRENSDYPIKGDYTYEFLEYTPITPSIDNISSEDESKSPSPGDVF